MLAKLQQTSEKLVSADYRAPRRGGELPANGRVRTRLTDPQSRFGVTVWQERGVMHVFTGDTLKRDQRRAVALEPMECMANGFNRPEWADAIRLEPGAERVFRCGVELS